MKQAPSVDGRAPAERASERIRVGRISGVFGVRGWVKIFSFTRPREKIIEYSHWYLGDASEPKAAKAVKVVAGRRQGRKVVAQLDQIATVEAAQAWIDCDVLIEREQLSATEADQFYWADLVGLQVCDVHGNELGEVTGLLETPGHDVLAVEQAGQRRLIPFTLGHHVTGVDLESGLIEVDWHQDD